MGAIAASNPVRPLRVLPLATLSDERLAELAGAGHSDALGALYERYRESLARYCRSIVRDSEDAGDALQNTMLAVLRALQGRSLTGPVRPWLYRVAHNESISILRRRHPHEELSIETPDRADTESASFAQARLDALLADLRSLPERQRGALVMRELGGLGYEEIAEALDLSLGAARKHVFEARVALHDIAAGREADCAEIVRQISDGDGRVLRARSVRGHLRGCPACAAFERGLRHRSETFALIPVLPVATTAALLVAVLHGGAASTSGFATGGSVAGGSVAGGSVAGGTVAAGTIAAAGSLLGGGSFAAIKGFAVAGAIAVAGAGVIVGTGITAHARHAHPALVAGSPAHVARARSATPAALPAAKPVRLAVVHTRALPAARPARGAALAPASSSPRRVSAVAPVSYTQSPTASAPSKRAPAAPAPGATTPTATPTPTAAPTPTPTAAAPPATTAPPPATTSPATPATATSSWIDAIIASALQRAGADWAAAQAQAQQQLAASGYSPASIQAIIAAFFSGNHG